MAMKILCTFPGKIGDALWSLPTARMISRHFRVPVDFCMTPEHASEGLLRLIGEQEYIANTYSLPGWTVEYKECMQPRDPMVGGYTDYKYDKVFDLGYAGWPDQELARYVHRLLLSNYKDVGFPFQLDMSPWIKVQHFAPIKRSIFVGWNHEWLELKMGLVLALAKSISNTVFCIPYTAGARHEEFVRINNINEIEMRRTDIYEAATMLARSSLYLGCLSALWVLACAMGKRCVVMEPSEARWNPIFWWDGEGRNRMVKGGDGKPTFDARHVRDAVLEELKRCGF